MSAAVECRDLVRRYGDVTAVDGLSFEVEEGEFFALLGPNGAGKTTTLHMLTTLVKPTSGTASVGGFDVLREAPEVRESIGLVFQEPALDDRLTGRENLRIHAILYGLAGGEVRRAVDDALAWASLEDPAGRTVRTYSGGMKRRLELARALLHRPRILFLDEPTQGLDPQGRRHLWDRIDALRDEGLTVVMTTHYLHEAEACDRVGIVDVGKLVALGTPGELKASIDAGPDATLEDVFIQLTGRALRDEGATAREQTMAFAKKGGEHTR